jgi:uncharacterized protein
VRIHESFTVPRPVDDVWAYLLNVERVAPCMPGAELTDTIDATHWKGLVNVAFGPMSMTFRGTVALEERDDAAHRVLLAAKGMEQRGKGAANATITATLEPIDSATRLSMDAEITLSGAAAQLSRGLLPEVSKQLTARFADCLRQDLEQLPGQSEPVAVRPVGGLRLGVTAMWVAALRWFRGLFGKRTDQPTR